MTDQELLQRAARAAGFTDFNIKTDPVFWNPLEDDEEALRLAVQLFIQVTPRSHSTSCRTLDVSGISEMHGDDPMAATRRAIVRAAAAMAGEE